MTKTEKSLEKYTSSVRFWILFVVCAYFAYAVYFAIYGLNFSFSLIHDRYVFSLVSQNPWWWAVLYYGSEGISGSVSIVLRAIGGAFAVFAAYTLWRTKDSTLPSVRSSASKALLLEACAFLALVPSIIAAFAYYLSSEYLYYFDHTPGQLLLFGTGIPCLAMVLVILPVLLKLRATIRSSSPNLETIRWTCITSVSYLFVVFWFNYSMLWAATMVPYPRSLQQYGMSFLLQPTNFASFLVTVFGLLLIATLALATTLPVIRKKSTELNLNLVGGVILAFGSYFIFNTTIYYLTGGYGRNPSVWYEVIGPLHNPYLWCASFVPLGLAILIYNRARKK